MAVGGQMESEIAQTLDISGDTTAYDASAKKLVAQKSILSEEFHISISTAIDEEVERMCNLSTGILERGIERGMKRGMERGVEKGRKEGIMETLFGLVKDGLLPVSAAAQRAGMDLSAFEREYERYCRK